MRANALLAGYRLDEFNASHAGEVIETINARGYIKGCRFRWSHDPERDTKLESLMARSFNGNHLDS